MLKHSNPHISFNISPNSKLFISEFSARWDLSNHGNELKKREIRIFTNLLCSVMKQWISSINLVVKLDVKDNSWNHLNRAQSSRFISIFNLWACMILARIGQSSGWFLLYTAPGSRIYQANWCLCEEFFNFDWEKNWREKCDLDLECVRMKFLLWLSLYTTC